MELSERNEAILKMLGSAGMSPETVDELFERAQDVTYWRNLNPELSIEADSPVGPVEIAPLSTAETDLQIEQLKTEWFFKTDPILDPVKMGEMRVAVERIIAERWPPVMAFVYDEFWQALRTPSLARVVTDFLGEGWRQNSLVWTFHVPNVKGAGGWAPHSDDALQQSVCRLTIWIPISEATTENGCMYVIPRDRMPATVPDNYSKVEGANRSELDHLLQAVKALPSPPGALIGWNHHLIHWGGYSSGKNGPRISIAGEFLAAGQVPRRGELPLIDPLRLPSFKARLNMLGNGIVEYGRVEVLMKKYAQFGARLRDC
jgi:hypothetical protein